MIIILLYFLISGSFQVRECQFCKAYFLQSVWQRWVLVVPRFVQTNEAKHCGGTIKW